MHATIDVRFELVSTTTKRYRSPRLPRPSLTRTSKQSFSNRWSRASTPPASRRSVVRNTHMAAVTSASNAPAPTPAQLSQLPENTSSLSTTSKIQPLPQTNPATSGPSKTFSTSTGRTAISRTSPPKRRSRYLAQLSRRCQSRRQLRLDAVADHHQPPCQNTATSSNSSFQTVSLAQTLTPSFLTGQSATAKTTTARPLRPSNARRRHRRRVTLLLDLSVNADWDETAAELDDIGAVTDDATVVSDADSGIVTAFTDENRDHQLDLVHVGRTLGYTLWDDGVFSLDRRKEDRFGGDRRGVPSEELCGEASSSGGVRGDPLADRANEAIIRRQRGNWSSSGQQRLQGIFGGGCRRCDVRRARCRGFEVPWTSNPVERLMGEVSKRCKNQWMRWTAEDWKRYSNFGW